MGKIELLCLGTGDAESALYDNVPCTSFALLLDGYPVLLVGVGPGILRAIVHYAHLVPECVLILNASIEQVNEISALAAFESANRRRIRVFASKEVCSVLSELLRVQLLDQPSANEYINLISLPVSPTGTNEFYSLVHDFSVMLHMSTQQGLCCSSSITGETSHSSGGGGGGNVVRPPSTCSAMLCYRDQPVVALSGPVPFDALLYAKLCQAPFVVVWASQQGSQRRASIYEVAAFSDKVNTSRRPEERVVFLVGGYGTPQDAPLLAGYVVLLHQGSPVVMVASDLVQSPFSALHLPLLNVRKSQPTKYPLNGKTTVLTNDMGGSGPSGDASGGFGGIGGSFTSGGYSSFRSPRGGAGGNTHGGGGAGTQPVALTAAALQQSGRGPSQTAGADAGSVDSAPNTPVVRGGGGGGVPNALERWVDPLLLGSQGLEMMAGGGNGNGNDARGSGGMYDTRKVFVFTNEDKGAPGKLLLLRNFRNLYQLAQRVAQMLSLKPIKEFYNASTGAVVRSLEELRDGCELIAVRRGGAPYNPLDVPRLLKLNSSSTKR